MIFEPSQQSASASETTHMMKNASRWVPAGPRRFFFALGALAVAFSARYALHGLFGEQFPFIFFTVAAVLVCAYAGMWLALVVVLVGLLLAFYFFIEPFNSIGVPNTEDITEIIVDVTTTMVLVILVEWLQRSKYEARLLLLETKYRNKNLQETIAKMEQAQRSAVHYEHKVRVITAAVPHIWCISNPNGGIEYVNAKLYEVTNAQRGSLEGEGWTKVMHPNDAELVKDISKRVAERGRSEEIGGRLNMADGSYRSFDTEV